MRNLPIDAKLLALAKRWCAVVEQESGWNPRATRHEPAFFANYVAPFFESGKSGEKVEIAKDPV
jgi:hypothetical protein